MIKKELMINDWVYVGKYNGAKQICALPDNNSWCICYHSSMEDGRQEYDWLHPIPLTEEILKANGFENTLFDNGTPTEEWRLLGMHYFKCRYNDSQKVWWISSDDAYFHFHYVHELQHALRLCGLNELADNFKIDRYD